MASANPDKVYRLQRNNGYPIQIWYLLATLILLVAVFQAASCLHAKLARRKQRDIDQESNSRANVLTLHPRRIPLAILNTYRVIAFRWTLNIKIGQTYTLNLAEVFLTIVYIIAIFTWTFINTTTISGKKLDFTYWWNRTGTIAASQFPLITALGTKNNFIGLLTGVSYEKLSYLHRMAARVVFILLWTHASGKLAFNAIGPEDLSTIWLRTGLMAVLAFSILFLVSLRPVRARSYGLFFWTHFTMVLVVLVGAYHHTREFMYQKYIWPCFVIWGLDRFIRILRIGLIFKASRAVSNSRSVDLASCNLEMISDNIIRLAIPISSRFHWSAGQSVFLTIQGVSLFLLGNPFTIASLDGERIRSENYEHTIQPAGPEKIEEASEVGQSELVFFLKIRSGFTKRLAAYAQTLDTDHPIAAKIFVDGPYGSPPNLKYFDTCVLIAGGTGVSYALPLLLDIVNKVRMGKSDCRRVLFVWAVRDIRHIDLISSTRMNALRNIPSALNVDIRIHVTQSKVFLHPESNNWDMSSVGHHSEVVAEKLEDRFTSISVLGLDTNLIQERPDIHAILKEEADATRGERLGVCVCGSDSMVHDTRSALGISTSGPSAVMSGGANVSLFVESFGYA